MATSANAGTFTQIGGPSPSSFSSSSSSSSSSNSFFPRFKTLRIASPLLMKQWSDSLSKASTFAAASARLVCYAAVEADAPVPIPIVLIDQDSDANATVVEVSFGDRLGALLDTMKALKDLGLDVVKGNVTTATSVIKTKFFITRSDTGRKIENPELLEKVRLTVLANLLKYHPESSESLALGEAWGIKAPLKKVDVDISTSIRIVDDGPKKSLLTIKTADKPGLLMEIIRIMNDININVESAEIDTEGLVAKDKFHVNYHGQALSKSLSEVLTNCLRYHLRRPVTDDESY
ncbi:hypothetical protein L7F22_040333 [Adiantum nelumboides]|nr:hypothetical protein [Adiantum nelumboides]